MIPYPVRNTFSIVTLSDYKSVLYLFKLAKLHDVGFILSLSAADVQRLTRLSVTDVATLHRAAAEAVPHPAPVTGLDHIFSVSSLSNIMSTAL